MVVADSEGTAVKLGADVEIRIRIEQRGRAHLHHERAPAPGDNAGGTESLLTVLAVGGRRQTLDHPLLSPVTVEPRNRAAQAGAVQGAGELSDDLEIAPAAGLGDVEVAPPADVHMAWLVKSAGNDDGTVLGRDRLHRTRHQRHGQHASQCRIHRSFLHIPSLSLPPRSGTVHRRRSSSTKVELSFYKSDTSLRQAVMVGQTATGLRVDGVAPVSRTAWSGRSVSTNQRQSDKGRRRRVDQDEIRYLRGAACDHRRRDASSGRAAPYADYGCASRSGRCRHDSGIGPRPMTLLQDALAPFPGRPRPEHRGPPRGARGTAAHRDRCPRLHRHRRGLCRPGSPRTRSRRRRCARRSVAE